MNNHQSSAFPVTSVRIPCDVSEIVNVCIVTFSSSSVVTMGVIVNGSPVFCCFLSAKLFSLKVMDAVNGKDSNLCSDIVSNVGLS